MIGQLGAARDTSSVAGCGGGCLIMANLMPLFCAAGLIATSESFHRMDPAGNWLTDVTPGHGCPPLSPPTGATHRPTRTGRHGATGIRSNLVRFPRICRPKHA